MLDLRFLPRGRQVGITNVEQGISNFEGYSYLLNKTQRNALIELSSQHEQLQIIIEKVISSSISITDKRNSYLGIPDDFFEKLGKPVSDNNKLQWLKYQYLNFDRKLDLYYFIQRRGDKRIIQEDHFNFDRQRHLK